MMEDIDISYFKEEVNCIPINAKIIIEDDKDFWKIEDYWYDEDTNELIIKKSNRYARV